MAIVHAVGIFLTLLTSGAHLSQEPNHNIGYQGGSTWFRLHCTHEADHISFNRSSAERSQILLNSSYSGSALFITMPNLRVSASGEYTSTCWKDGDVTEQRAHHLTVCAGQTYEPKVNVLHGRSTDLVCENSNSTEGSSIRLYRQLLLGDTVPRLILDTNTSFEILPGDLKGRIKKVHNCTASFHFTDALPSDAGLYYCLTMKGDQCVHLHANQIVIAKKLLTSGMTHTLACIINGSDANQEDVEWDTPRGIVKLQSGDVPLLVSNTTDSRSSGQRMYMLNGSLTGNYSLVIPSLSANHSGHYQCRIAGPYIIVAEDWIAICTDQEPANMMFSLGDSAVLLCDPNRTDPSSVQWYRQRGLEPEDLILDSENESVVFPAELRGRVNASNPRSSLVVSDLSPIDSGVYWCKVWGILTFKKGFCLNRRINLIYKVPKDPFGIDSTFYRVYASLVGCLLLCMICAVITVELRLSRYQASQRTTRSPAEPPGHLIREGEQWT